MISVSHPRDARLSDTTKKRTNRSYKEMSSAGNCRGSVLCDAGEAQKQDTAPSHLTGFLHTLGGVFQLSHQILKKRDTHVEMFSNGSDLKIQPAAVNTV